ncbi:TonB-dependent receptor [uncultured Bacteroides sp.]|uniref:TonB-dependent receptor domain-containing protein n=1 Tax=uncultured Bacteroides sp. TaxID=162156 RepID=UPI00261539DC|nr:TonB-dependent receptor [uncultured Bacteroides sp.]
MRLVKVFFSGLFGSILSVSLPAQTLSGKLIDENSQSLPYANVVLLSLPDSAFVSGTISGEDGSFTLEATSENQIVKISSIGYQTVYKPTVPANIGIVKLLSDAQQLGEVVIKADLPKTRVKGNAMVTTVAGSVLEKAGTGNDLLDKIPGLSADDGSVNVFGSGVAEIYINGRKMRNSSELDQLSSDEIISVEVLRNPGARYDASVKAVVRIITKKPQGEGFGFNNRAYVGYQYDLALLDQFNFNYRKGGFDLGGMLFGRDSKFEENKILTQKTYLDKVWTQNSDMKSPFHTQEIAAMLSLNYQFNENQVVGVRYDFGRNPQIEMRLDMNSSIHVDNLLEEESKSNTHSMTTNNRHTVNAYYNGDFNDWNVDFNVDGMWIDNNNPIVAEEYVKQSDHTEEYSTIHTLGKSRNELYAAKLIMEHPLWEGNLSIGGEYTYSSRTDSYVNDENIIPDNENRIRENAVSAFAMYARSFGQLQAQAGVRYEHLNSDYYEFGKRMDGQSRTYDNVFPSVSVSYPIGKVQLMVSYSGNIERPSYYKLSSAVTYGNKYTYESGNPLLRSSIQNTLSLNTSWKWLYFNVNYSRIKDMQIQVSKLYSNADPSISLFTHTNVPKVDKLNATLSASPTIGIWSPQFAAMYSQQWFVMDTPDGPKNLNNPICFFQWNNTFSFPKDFQLNIDLETSTRGEDSSCRIIEPGSSVNLSLYKGFWDGKLTVQLQANDIFNTSSSDILMYSGNRITILQPESRRSFGMTIRYKFNATKSKYKGTGAGDSQKNRM